MRKRKGRWLLLLFSLIFIAAGLGFLFLSIIPSLQEWRDMRFWPLVDARLEYVELDQRTRDGSTTYQVIARYTYSYQGQRYTGNRVGIMGGSDNQADFHRQLASRLEAAWRADDPVDAWVNPHEPGDAVLHRDMRWNMLGYQLLFALIFGCAGGVMLFGVLWVKSSSLGHPRAGTHPWLDRPEWSDNQIACDARGSVWSIWVFALFWNLVSLPLWWVIPKELAEGNKVMWIAALFPVVGIILLGSAVRTTRSWRRFGQLTLVMDPFPGALGGQVGGHLELPLPYDNQQRFPVALTCVRSYMSGSGKHRTRKESLVWQAQGLAYARPATAGTRLDFCFDVPDGLPASELHANSYHLWRLEFKGDLPGVNLSRRFEIPVYPTGEKSRYQQLSVEHPQAVEERDALIESVLDIRQIAGGVELFFPMLRNPSAGGLGLLFGVAFLGVGSIMRNSSDAPGYMVWFFIIIGILGVFFSLKALFSSLHVRLNREGLFSQGYWLGIPVRKDMAPRTEIVRLAIETSYRQEANATHTEVFNINAITRSGKKIPVAKSLKGRETAQQALEAIAGLSGYPIE